MATYTATDDDGDTISWSLPNTSFETDRGDFDISSSGVLRFKGTPDYENPDDSNDDNVYRITVRASDGNLTASRNVTVTVNQPLPTITITRQDATVTEGQDVLFTLTASSAPAAALTVNVSVTETGSFLTTGATSTQVTIAIGTTTAQLNLQTDNDTVDEANGTTTATVLSGTGYVVGSPSSASVVVLDNDLANQSPMVASAIADMTMTAGTSTTISLLGRFSDPDGDTLNYTATSSAPGVATVTVSGATLTLTASSAGASTITVTAADRATGHADRLTVTDEFSVTVTQPLPTITIARQAASVTEGQDVQFTLTASSAPATALTVNVSVTETGSFLTTGATSTQVSFAGRNTTTQLQLQTTDDAVDEANGTTTVAVLSGTGYSVGSPSSASVVVQDNDLANQSPMVASRIADMTMTAGTSTTIDLSNAFSDPDGDTLNYTANSSNTTAATVSVSGATVTLTASSAGTSTIAVTAADRSSGHADRLTVTDDFSVTVTQPLPTVTITRQDATVTEGQDVLFTLTASTAPTSEIHVNVSVTETGSFLTAGATSTQVTISMGTTTAQLTLQTDNDAVDEADGTTAVAILSGVGYSIGSPRFASVAVEDNDVPLAPTGLRANGDLDSSGNVTLRWNPVADATGYNVRYVKEVCTPGMKCEPDGGLANPNWQMHANITTSGGATEEAVLGGLATSTLYRVEVQAVIVDTSTSSDFAFVYPTRNPPTSTTSVALLEISDFQADGQDAGSYRYTICLDDPMTVSNPMISGAWTVTEIIAEVKDSVETWETAVEDSSILSTTADPETSPDNCGHPRYPSTQNQIVFLKDSDMNMTCHSTHLACWRNMGGVLFLDLPFWKQSIVLRASGGGVAWDTVTNGCTRLRSIVAHEVGHAFGIGHPDIGPAPDVAVRKMYLMFSEFQGICEPQPYDVAAAMANYQSR